MKSTPGPWRVVDRLDKRDTPCGLSIWADDAGNENQYGDKANILVASLPDGATVGGGHAWPHQADNARLIAASPALLDSCQYIDSAANLDVSEMSDDYAVTVNMTAKGLRDLQAAIALATT